jgi:pilus assembly protein Flp/PilA
LITNFIAVLNDDQGQGLAEYALILFLVSVVSVVTLTTLGTTISAKFTAMTADL